MGAARIRDVLPNLIEKLQAAGLDVAWVSDPMHGNGYETSTGYKTRRFDDVIDEVRGSSRCTAAWAPGRVACTSSSPGAT